MIYRWMRGNRFTDTPKSGSSPLPNLLGIVFSEGSSPFFGFDLTLFTKRFDAIQFPLLTSQLAYVAISSDPIFQLI